MAVTTLAKVALPTALSALLGIAVAQGVYSAAAEQAFDSFRQAREEALASCGGPYKGRSPSDVELTQLLDLHRSFLRDHPLPQRIRSAAARADPRRASLCGAVLARRDLVNVELTGADLRAANLAGANLTGANLWGADLSYVFATQTDFSGSAINTGRLEGAWLQRASLENSILAYASLRGAFLLATKLGGANVAEAQVAGAVYEPELGAVPDFSTLVTVNDLKQLTYDRSPHALHELREAFKRAGLRDHEAQITYAIRHNERLKAGGLESFISYVLFELTTGWGMYPSRALLMLALLVIVFAVPYIMALRFGRRDGIWRVWDESRLRRDVGEEQRAPLRLAWHRAIPLALYFSVLSAFRVGWREFNIGEWIARMQPSEYHLRATGWVKAIAGFQSLVSVYLLAIWALTYFGRPFE